ncbi:MAG: outer membrane beta-barrel protein [Balneola sp.]
MRYILVSVFLSLLLIKLTSAQEIIQQKEVDESKGKSEKIDTLSNSFLSFSIGFGYRTAQVSKNLNSSDRSFAEKGRLGIVFHGSFAHYISDNLGLSLTFSNYRSENSEQDRSVTTSYYFIGPGVSARNRNNKHSIFYVSAHLGYVGFKSEEYYNSQDYTFTGATIGLDGSLGIDFLLSNSLSFQVDFGYTNAFLLRVKDEEGQTHTLGEAESLNRIDFKVGLKIYL